MWYDIATKDDHEMLTIGLIYRPPNATEEDDEKLRNLLTLAEKRTLKGQLLVFGDFNYPKIQWNKNDSICRRSI